MARVIGKFPSMKMNRMIEYQSLIELDFIYLLEFAPQITTYKEQPFTLEFIYEKKKRRYTPDFYFKCDGKGYVIECKHVDWMRKKKNQYKWDAMIEWCAENNAQFYVVTNEQIRSGYQLENIKTLYDYARYTIDVREQKKVISLLTHDNNSMVMSELMTGLCAENPNDAITTIMHMLYHKSITTSLHEQPIDVHSLISLPIDYSPINVMPFDVPILEKKI